ncbi:MAG TPA: hypothetical protein VIL16_03015 [Trebonia sp.]
MRASRLPVPIGMIAKPTPVPATPSAHAATVPSPPQARTRSTPAATADLAWPRPGSSGVVSSQSGSSQP